MAGRQRRTVWFFPSLSHRSRRSHAGALAFQLCADLDARPGIIEPGHAAAGVGAERDRRQVTCAGAIAGDLYAVPAGNRFADVVDQRHWVRIVTPVAPTFVGRVLTRHLTSLSGI